MQQSPDSALIEARGALLLKLRQEGISDIRILRAIESVPREAFLPFHLRDLANSDYPLPIECGQTMEAPGALAALFAAAELQPDFQVLEIGAGSGYAAAILAQLVREIVAVERFHGLAVEARARFERLSLTHIRLHCADGFASPEQYGSFDRILIHARLDSVPSALFPALKPHGRIVCALDGAPGAPPALACIDAHGAITRRRARCAHNRPLSGVSQML